MNSERSKIRKWFEAKADFSGQLLFDEPLSKHTYYRIGGAASIFAVPKTRSDLQWLSDGIRETGIPFFILGMGSNLLVSDEGFPGLVIRTTKLNLEMTALTSERIRVGASVAISSLLRRAAQEGWGGLEFLTGIPGSVGGAVKMNAGTHLGETQSCLRKVESVSLRHKASEVAELQIYEDKDLQFEYRKNLFLPEGDLVYAVEWEVTPTDPAQVKRLIDQTLQRRKSTQPIDAPSCGSVFKNPKSYGKSAWAVVDQLGLRGHQIGGAQFAEKHSNFILNLGNAKAADVRALIQLAKFRAQSELGILLEEEVKYVGSF